MVDLVVDLDSDGLALSRACGLGGRGGQGGSVTVVPACSESAVDRCPPGQTIAPGVLDRPKGSSLCQTVAPIILARRRSRDGDGSPADRRVRLALPGVTPSSSTLACAITIHVAVKPGVVSWMPEHAGQARPLGWPHLSDLSLDGRTLRLAGSVPVISLTRPGAWFRHFLPPWA